jgi:hypothetical protein
MAESTKTEKQKGSEIDSETAARERTRRLQPGAQGAGKDGPITNTPPDDEDKRPDHKTGRG